MSTVNDGGPAFPCDYFDRALFDELRPDEGIHSAKKMASLTSPGMTLRDAIAIQAMCGLLSAANVSGPKKGQSFEEYAAQIADASFVYADAFLRRRSR